MTSNLATICSVAVLLLILSKLVAYKQLQAKSARLGCSPTPVLPQNDPLGLTRLFQFLKARTEKRAIPWMSEIMDLAGKDVHTAKDTMMGKTFIWSRDVDNARAILSAQASDFDIAIARQKSLLVVTGDGIFTRSGERWKESHAFLKPQFTRNQVSSLGLEKHVQALLDAIGGSEGSWTSSFDIQPLLFNFTLDVATEFLFGTSANSQSTSTDDVSRRGRLFGYHFDAAATYFDGRAILGSYCWLYSPRKFREHCRGIRAYADGYVHEALMQKRKGDQEATADRKDKFILLDKLVELTTDPVRIRDECLNVLGAGRTSTASLIAWNFYFLARHPATFDKLRKAVLADFGGFENSDEITFESLKRCQFLQCCINEASRMVPVAPIHLRVAVRDTTLPKGGGVNGQDPIFVPKNTEIRQTYYSTCMRTDIWGEDAASYRPERFENRPLSSEWMPFGAGPRLCLGRKSYVNMDRR